MQNKISFLPVKDAMDKALLEEIRQLKEVNAELQSRFTDQNVRLRHDNTELTSRVSSMAAQLEEARAQEA